MPLSRDILLTVAEHYGTPVYVYDLERLRLQYKQLQKHFEAFETDIHFAVKSNNNPHIIREIQRLGGKFDTVSPQEVEYLRELGIQPGDILFTPSCAAPSDLYGALRQGVRVHADALEQLEWLAKQNCSKPLGIRINPGILSGGNKKINTAHDESKFGIAWDYKDRILEVVKHLKINGLHIHLGSDIAYMEAMKNAIGFLFDIRKYFPDLEYLDIGGGFKIPYAPEDSSLDFNEITRFIHRKMEETSFYPKIKIEPGKFLVSEAGYFLMQVNMVKQSPKKMFACVNTGFNHMIRPMYYDAYHHIENLSNPAGKPQVYDVVGNLCEEDTFGRNRKLPEVRPGDILVLKNAGAYGMVMASRYNLRPLPKEVIVDGRKIYES
jgi:diaminopimelate decarboxylase